MYHIPSHIISQFKCLLIIIFAYCAYLSYTAYKFSFIDKTKNIYINSNQSTNIFQTIINRNNLIKNIL